jgi:predicted RND superfamily exporter protein
MTTLKQFAEDDELGDMAAFEKSVDFIITAFKEQDLEKLRKQRTSKLFELAQVTDPSEKFKQLVESAVWCLGDPVAFLPKNDVSPAVLAAAVDSKDFEVIPSGYPVIYRAMNASVIHNQIWSLVCSFIMVFIVLCCFIGVIRAAIVSLIPASVTVLLTFGTMGALNIGMDVGSSMIAAISLSVGIDYACHLIWKYRVSNLKPKSLAAECADHDGSVSIESAEAHIQNASDRMLETTGWGIVINALEVGIGLSVLYFGELLPMRNFGLLTGFAMIVSAIASLVLLSALLRMVSMNRFKRYMRKS